ncbi:MAG: hypothetical protein K6G51_01055 [Sphaerochaetaceae bacterium]|nr:hypothetical protein [Sphaerochaetaceae bacterium]
MLPEMDFTIKLKIDDEEKLYDSFDPSGITLSGDVVSYLEDCIYDRKLGESVTLELFSKKNIDMDHFTKALDKFLEKKEERLKREHLKNKLNSYRLLVIGIIFVIIGIVFASKLNAVLAAIVSTIGSFSIWEASNVWLQIIPELRKEMLVINKLQKGKSKLIIED